MTVVLARASCTIISTHVLFLSQSMILSEIDMKYSLIVVYTLTNLYLPVAILLYSS
ncbi:hypothetical protein AB4K20DRAFT_1880856 [Rhizopus microsporus]